MPDKGADCHDKVVNLELTERQEHEQGGRQCILENVKFLDSMAAGLEYAQPKALIADSHDCARTGRLPANAGYNVIFRRLPLKKISRGRLDQSGSSAVTYIIVHAKGVHPKLSLGRCPRQGKVDIVTAVHRQACDPSMAAGGLLLHINVSNLQQRLVMCQIEAKPRHAHQALPETLP